jgi:hypothetical protein
MSHLLNVLFRTIFLPLIFCCFIFSNNVFSQTCNNWLNTPSQPSWVNVGDIDVPGNQLTVEALINIKGIPPGGVIQGLDVVSKHTGPANVNYLLRCGTKARKALAAANLAIGLNKNRKFDPSCLEDL